MRTVSFRRHQRIYAQAYAQNVQVFFTRVGVRDLAYKAKVEQKKSVNLIVNLSEHRVHQLVRNNGSLLLVLSIRLSTADRKRIEKNNQI